MGHQIPWAYAQGYVLPSLRGYRIAQLQNLRFSLSSSVEVTRSK
jgi:hypothetical protein